MRQELLQKFYDRFGQGSEARVFFSPGRVNLIGEHIDYNGGLVFPCALSMGTYGVVRKRDDSMIKLFTSNFDSALEFSVDDLSHNPLHKWGNYVKGVIVQLLEAGAKIGGFELYIWGNLPNGAGLSSSASLNTLFAIALCTIFEFDVDPIERALMCQRAEHFNGINCGIMDPFACGMGKENHAILLNCATLEYEQIPLELGDYCILIANTNYKRGLADAKYNERRAECDQALADLQTVLVNLKEICELTPEEFEKNKNAIKNQTNRNRAEHAVYENYRTKAAAKALTEGRLTELYTYMEDSHTSLRDLYDVVGDALDAMVQPTLEYARKYPDRVLGSRMTGAGFGGCTVSIVHKDFADEIKKYVGDQYKAATGTDATFYIAEVSGGAGEVL